MANTARKSRSFLTQADVKTEGAPTKQKSAKNSPIDSQQRYDMIAESAYLMAEQRGFEGEAAMDDWLRAESEVDMKLAAKE